MQEQAMKGHQVASPAYQPSEWHAAPLTITKASHDDVQCELLPEEEPPLDQNSASLHGYCTVSLRPSLAVSSPASMPQQGSCGGAAAQHSMHQHSSLQGCTCATKTPVPHRGLSRSQCPEATCVLAKVGSCTPGSTPSTAAHTWPQPHPQSIQHLAAGAQQHNQWQLLKPGLDPELQHTPKHHAQRLLPPSQECLKAQTAAAAAAAATGPRVHSTPRAYSSSDTGNSEIDVATHSSIKETIIARQQLLQELAQERELQRSQLLSRHMLRWRVNHAAIRASRPFKNFLQRLRLSQMPAAQRARQRQVGGWRGENGEAEAVSTAIERRLQHVEALVVPTAIGERQAVRRLLRDRNQGVLHAIKALWQDRMMARRLLLLATDSATAASASNALEAASGRPQFRDPLTQGLRAKLTFTFPNWVINFRSGYNPDTDKSWLKQQWGKPPFSTALEDAVEHRLQWEGASWCGGPKTEQGLWIYEDMQLRHMLAEQRRALRRVRLRRVLSNLPGLGHLETVLPVELLGSLPQYGQQAPAADAMWTAAAAAHALESNICCLELLLSCRRAAVLQAASAGLMGVHVINSSSKRRLLLSEARLKRRQQQLQLMRESLPVLQQHQCDLAFHQECMRKGMYNPQPPPQDPYWEAPFYEAPTQPLSAPARQEQLVRAAGSSLLSIAPRARHGAALLSREAAMLLADGVQDDGGKGREVIPYDPAALKAAGLFEAASEMWQGQHEDDLRDLQECIALANEAVVGVLEDPSEGDQDGPAELLLQQQEQQQQQRWHLWPWLHKRQQQQQRHAAPDPPQAAANVAGSLQTGHEPHASTASSTVDSGPGSSFLLAAPQIHSVGSGAAVYLGPDTQCTMGNAGAQQLHEPLSDLSERHLSIARLLKEQQLQLQFLQFEGITTDHQLGAISQGQQQLQRQGPQGLDTQGQQPEAPQQPQGRELQSQQPQGQEPQRQEPSTREMQEGSDGMMWLQKHTHRFKAPWSFKDRQKAVLKREAQLEAVSELFSGLPVWQDLTCIGTLTPAEITMAAECLWPAAQQSP